MSRATDAPAAEAPPATLALDAARRALEDMSRRARNALADGGLIPP